MCTVVYIPTSGGFILSSNRDENPQRQSADPEMVNGNTGELIFPAVEKSKSSWIGAHEEGHVMVLLNGAFARHERQNNYRKSRGRILYDMLDNLSPKVFWEEVDLENIEPFTLIIVDQCRLYEMVWDGETKHKRMLDSTKPYLWSSSTLYDPVQKSIRNRWFENWFTSEKKKNKIELLHFLFEYNDPDFGFVMCRNNSLKTISISILERTREKLEFDHYKLSGDNLQFYSTQNILNIGAPCY